MSTRNISEICRVSRALQKKAVLSKNRFDLYVLTVKKSQFPGRRVQRSTSRGRTCKFTITYSCMSYCKFWIYCQTRVDTKFTIGQLYSMTQPRADPEIFQRGYEETKKGGGGWSEHFGKKVLVYSRYRHMCKHNNQINIQVIQLILPCSFPFVCFRLPCCITFIYIQYNTIQYNTIFLFP